MIITNNIPALQAATNLGKTNKALAKSMNNLSIGTKINSAKDDAAGMAITNKLKVQIQGLKTASQNSLDGVSLIQTAEGALNEVHNMLQRMRELAVQAANDTNVEEDRVKIWIEFNGLQDEITAVSSRTEFNKIKILSGELYKYQEGDELKWGDPAASSETPYAAADPLYGNLPPITAANKAMLDGFKNDLTLQVGPNTLMEFDFSIPKITAKTLGLEKFIGDWSEDPPAGSGNYTLEGEWQKAWPDPTGYSPDSDEYKEILSWQTAESMLAKTDLAINRVSAIRADLGAAQNRLEHTILSLDNTALNTDTARSRLEDTDMALETITYSTKNVIAQSAIAIIAQANQRPQSILQLM